MCVCVYVRYSTVNNSQMIGSLDCLYDGTNNLPSLDVFKAWLGDLNITINDTIAVRAPHSIRRPARGSLDRKRSHVDVPRVRVVAKMLRF